MKFKICFLKLIRTNKIKKVNLLEWDMVTPLLHKRREHLFKDY